MRIWDKEHECMARSQMRTLQLERLKSIVQYAYDKVPMYKQKFDQIGLKPRHIESLKDIEKIPFTTKDDLRDNYPFGLLAVSLKDIVEIHASSGTTGKPVVVGYTRKDMDVWTDCVARIITMAGVTEDDVAQVAFGYGLFTGGFGLHYGLQRVGATVVPMSSGNSERQLMLMQDFGATALIATPSYALRLTEVMEEMGMTKNDFKLKVGLFGGEGHSNELAEEIVKRWGIIDTENYGMTEITGPGVSGECLWKTGMHVNEDVFYPEIIDPATQQSLDIGEKGEMVLTTLLKEGIPMLRFRTKDITFLDDKPCECGRTLVRMGKVQGRTDDMMIIRGVNVFPSQIESVILKIPEVGPHYQILLRKRGFLDEIEVLVELVDASVLESYKKLESIEKHIKANIKSVLQIDAKVRLVEPFTIERTTGKAKRVVDLRNEPESKS